MTDLIQRARELEIQAKNDDYLIGKNKGKLKGENLIAKGHRIEKVNDAQKKRFLFLLDKEKQILEEKTKDNVNMLQRSMEQGVEFMKLGKKKRHKPVQVIEVGKLEDDAEIPRSEKIIYYIEKYRLPYIKFGMKLSYAELENDIQKFEKKFLKQLLNFGKDKKFGEYGLFIKSV
jgi:hypothetical protein